MQFAENCVVEIAVFGQRLIGDVLAFVCGHTGPTEIDASGRMLLPLHTSQGTRKLREDVRAPQIRIALVGHVLREVAEPLQRR